MILYKLFPKVVHVIQQRAFLQTNTHEQSLHHTYLLPIIMRSIQFITLSMMIICFAGSVLSAPLFLPMLLTTGAIAGGANGYVQAQTDRAKVEKRKQDAVNRQVKQIVQSAELKSRLKEQYFFAVLQNILSRSDNTEKTLTQVLDYLRAVKKYNPSLVPDNYEELIRAAAPAPSSNTAAGASIPMAASPMMAPAPQAVMAPTQASVSI